MTAGALCGVWVDPAGGVHRSLATAEGGRIEDAVTVRPFAWLAGEPRTSLPEGVTLRSLEGEGAFPVLAHADTLEAYDALLKSVRGEVVTDGVRPIESLYLLQERARLFADVSFAQLRRCQLDIETASV